jgi:flagellar hook-associated protein 2
MASVQLSGLISGSFNWQSVVDQLITAESTPITDLNTKKTKNSDQTTALQSLQTAMSALQDSLQSIRAGGAFSGRTVTTDNANNTWVSTSSSGAAIGTYKFSVQQLATTAQVQGAANLGQGLSASSDVSGVTMATMRTATPVTAGAFTVNGQQVTVALTDSLQDVFNNISIATGGNVTGSYDPATDKVSLTSASGELVLGATNDTSNFFQVMKLNNNGTSTTASSATLGVLQLTTPLASCGLNTALTGQDSSGNGSILINGVTINYNINTDNLGLLINNINQSGAGVTATYDSANDRLNLVNNTTGDVGLGASDGTGNLLAALGATPAAGGVFTHGTNALYTVNDGPVLTSASNTLDSSSHGITGLSVTVNSKITQTVQVLSDTASMMTSVQDFITKFNAVQTAITTDTNITASGGNVTTSILSGNSDVEGWASNLQSLAFDPVSGLNGTVQRLDNLGIDFNSTTGQLSVVDSAKLNTALANNPTDVQNFFLTPTTGFVAKMFNYLTGAVSDDVTQQAQLAQASSDIDTQIATIQTKLDNERTQLTNAFIAMQNAQSAAQTQLQALNNILGGGTTASTTASTAASSTAVTAKVTA